MKRLGRALAFVLVVAALCLVSVGRAPAAENHSGAWDVIVSIAHCPRGFLCHAPVVYVEPNYGQALKLARELAPTLSTRFTITIERAS